MHISMQNHQYQVCVFGDNPQCRSRIVAKITRLFSELGLGDADYIILNDDQLAFRDRKSASVALYFGFSKQLTGSEMADALLRDSVSIIPVVPTISNYTDYVPNQLRPINGAECSNDIDETGIAALALENLSLLRTERRLFISYKREDSTAIAEQIFDAMTDHGFDCFLDTKSVRPSSKFQDELWHRLADSDVVILLDSPNFRKSHWTVQELTQANATNVQILHLLWPSVSPDPTSSFSLFEQIHDTDFDNRNGTVEKLSTLTNDRIAKIVRSVESLRARAIAARQTALIDSFADLLARRGISATLQPDRYLEVNFRSKRYAFLPTVGVPSSERLHKLLIRLRKAGIKKNVFSLYDERGILEDWRAHLNWLSDHLPVKTVETGHVDSWIDGELR